MAERLTRNNKVNFYFHDEASNMVYYKLQGLEDILEKYGIESVEELDYLLEVFKKMRKQYGKLNQENCKSKKQLNTWKRAAEMMGEELDMYAIKEDNNISTTQYFYQQAKTEGNDEK